ncbi:hypothetical protein [Actinomadura sp. HBU206391]|uniref:hypothetical protein n=1 Tax=Actinomadura sp. HBU206391 TaxID=2731692 RepID=UPI00165026DC|nr:hypothetical protein [Actinomadura sp. HBU206391]MBC6461918.1 hypothetical protein [Actinomadura sp. HBU206391]
MTDVGRRGLLGLGVVVALGACRPVEPVRAAPTPKASPGPGDVRRDTAPLERRFTALGRLLDAHWLGHPLGVDSRLSVPGPTDVRVVGIARLRAGRAAAIVSARRADFRARVPSRVPDPLTGFMPPGAGWVGSAAFDSEITRDAYYGAFHLDPESDHVYFDTTDPVPAPGGGPS